MLHMTYINIGTGQDIFKLLREYSDSTIDIPDPVIYQAERIYRAKEEAAILQALGFLLEGKFKETLDIPYLPHKTKKQIQLYLGQENTRETGARAELLYLEKNKRDYKAQHIKVTKNQILIDLAEEIEMVWREYQTKLLQEGEGPDDGQE